MLLPLLVVCIFSRVEANAAVSKEALDLLDQRLHNYDRSIVPGNKVTVFVQMYIRSLYLYETAYDREPHFAAQITLRERWHDPMLDYQNDINSVKDQAHWKGYLTVPNDRFDKIWTPDTFFSNEAAAEPLERTGDRMMRVFENGTVLVSVRIKHSFHCRMDHSAYPYGIQKCLMEIGSYGNPADVVSYEWYQSDPLKLKDDIYIPGYKLMDHAAVKPGDVSASTGEYSSVQANFLFERDHTRMEHVELFLVPASYVLASFVAFVLPNWQTHGLVLLVLLVGLYNVALPNILENHPLAKVSFAHDWLVGCVEFLLVELVVLFALSLVEKFLKWRGARSTASYRAPTTDDHDHEIDEMQLVKVPQRDEYRFINYARYGALAIFIFAFTIWAIVSSANLYPVDPRWPTRDEY